MADVFADLKIQTASNLLQLYCQVIQELNRRSICRSTNNPVADVAELLAVQSLGLSRAPKSTKGYNATDRDGHRYEIKSRRITSHNPSRMLSAIRDCKARHFDYLVGILFREDFSVYKACVVPFEIVLQESKYREHTNAHILELKDEIWSARGVLDISSKISAALLALDGMAASAK